MAETCECLMCLAEGDNSPHRIRSAELLPCPFCGPGNSMVDPWFDDVSKRWAVGCGRCGASSGRSVHAEGSKEAAIKSWNTRGLTPRATVTIVIPDGYADADEFLKDCQFERAEPLKSDERPSTSSMHDLICAIIQDEAKYDATTNCWDVAKAANDIITAFDTA